MHFRVRKNVIQLIRTTYDQGKKKSNNTTVGAVRLVKPVLTDELRQAMTAGEIAEFESWVGTQLRVDTLQAELAALTLAETMARAGKWFAREGDSVAARTTAAGIVFQWQDLRRLMAKHGLLD